MKFPKIALVLSFLLLLTACSPKNNLEDGQKKDFFIETQEYQDLDAKVYIEKPGKVVGSQEILVTAQAYGRISSIYAEEGDKVSGGEPVIQLSDDIMNYKLQVDRTKENLDSAVLSYEQTELSLNKAISDSQLAVEQANHNLETTQKSAKQMLLQAQQQLLATDLSEGGQARLTLDKLITDIENQIVSFKSQFLVQRTQLLNTMDDVLHETDTIIGASDSYKHFNDSYEVYLGAKDSAQKKEAKELILELYKTKELIKALPTSDISNQDLVSSLAVMEASYGQMDELLDTVRSVLENSLANSAFPQTTIDGFIAKIDILQSTSQGLNSSFVVYKTQVNSLLANIVSEYTSDEEQIQNLAAQQIDIATANAENARTNAEIAYEQTKINVENSIFNAELSVKNAKLTYDTAVKNKKTQLAMLENSIDQARIAYQDALTQYNKLSVRAPIAGIISSVLVDEAQEVSAGTPLFQIVSHKDQLVEIFVTAEEYELIRVGTRVWVQYGTEKYKAEIKAISPIANQSTLYKAIIEMDENLKLLGDVVSVAIPVELEENTLPLNIVTTLKGGSGFVYAMTESGMIQYDVKLGKTRGDRIEILSRVPRDLQIITSDLSNFDANKFELVVKESEQKNEEDDLFEEDDLTNSGSNTSGDVNIEIDEYDFEEDSDLNDENGNDTEDRNEDFEFGSGDDPLEELIEFLESV